MKIGVQETDAQPLIYTPADGKSKVSGSLFQNIINLMLIKKDNDKVHDI